MKKLVPGQIDVSSQGAPRRRHGRSAWGPATRRWRSPSRPSAPVGVIVLAYMLGQLGNALPLPGGVGGVEPLMLGVLTASGVNLGLAAAAIVVYRFVSLGIQAVAGAIAVATLTTAPQRSARAAAPHDFQRRVDSGPLRASSETNDHTGGTP